MINWTEILSNVGVFGLITGAISWLVKALGQNIIDRRFTAFEKELDIKSQEYQAALNADLESHKAKLNIEHTQYLKLHEKRLEIMTELYQRISTLDSAMITLTARMKPLPEGQTPQQQDWEHMNVAHEAYTYLHAYYEGHKIFFNEVNCDLLDKLIEKYREGFFDGTVRQRIGTSDPEFTSASAKKASETVREHIPPIRKSLEDEFRATLGVK